MQKTQVILINQRIFEYVKDFFYGAFYPLSLLVISLISFISALYYFAFIYIVLCACISFICFRDLTPLIPLALFACFIFRDFNFYHNAIFYIILAPAGVCFIAHFILYPIKEFVFGKVFLAIVLATVALFCGGLLSKYLADYAENLLKIILTGPAVLFIYLLLVNYLCPPEHFDLKTYCCITLVSVGLLIATEVCYYYYHFYVLQDTFFSQNNIGWGNTNATGMVLLMTIPACYYFLTKSKIIFPYLLALAFLYVSVFLSGSDGSFAIVCAFTPFMMLFTFIRMKIIRSRLILLGEIFIALVLAFLFLLVFKPEFFEDIWTYLSENANNDSSRTPMYKEAWALFLQNPIFGASMGYYNDILFSSDTGYSVHSTLFQILGSLGLVGVFAYFYYFYARYQVIMGKNHAFNLYMFLSFTMINCYGFIDTCEFSLIPTLLFTTIIVVITEKANDRNPDVLLERLSDFTTPPKKRLYFNKIVNIK